MFQRHFDQRICVVHTGKMSHPFDQHLPHGPQHTRLVKRWLTPPLHLAFSLVKAKATRFTHAGVRRGKHLLAFLSLIERQWNMPRPMHGSSEGYIGRGSDPGENEAENC